MESKIKEISKIIFRPENRIKLFVALGVIGVLLILLSEVAPHDESIKKDNSEIQYDKYISSLEEKTTSIISSIDGVGECRVMLTLSSTDESVYAKNTEEKMANSSYSKNNEYVLYDGTQGDEPILIKQVFPTVQGVVVVCTGGDNVVVRERIINSVSSLFDVPSSRISVSKLEG